MKKNILSKIVLVSLIVISLVTSIVNTVFADPTEVSSGFPILYDHWKNGDGWQQVIDASGNPIDVNGSAVEYNGLRIVKRADSGTLGTVYCKSGDTLGITSWIKTYSESNGSQYWPKEDYLTLMINSSCYSIFRNSIPQLSDRANFDYPNNSDPVLTYSLNPDGSNPSWFGNTGFDSSIGAHKWGSLYYIKFGNANGTTANGHKYTLMSNAVNYNGDWIQSMIGWPTLICNWSPKTISEENIQVYDNKPIPTITGTSNNGSAAIKINVADATVGIQRYTYTITAPNGTVTTKTVQATDKGYDESSKSYGTWLAPSQIGYLGGIGGAAETLTHPAYNLTEIANVSGAGKYHIHVVAINNLGFKDDNNFDGDIIVPTPSPQPTPDNPDNPSGPSNPDNPDNPDEPKEIPLTVSASVIPNPAKQGQQVTFLIHTTGKAKYLYVYPPVEITSNDTRGTIFPLPDTIPEEDSYDDNNIKYIIPLKTTQTIRKNESRVRAPYKVIIIAKRQDGKTAETTVDLDISGNVLEGIKTEIIGSGYDKKN